MTPRERDVALRDLHKTLDTIHRTKSTDYAGKEDVLANFKTIAEEIGLTKYQVWSVYFNKHRKAISHAIKHNPEVPQVESEPLEGRIHDAVIYLYLLYLMLVEDKAKRQKKKLKTGTPECDQPQTSSETSTPPSGYPYAQDQDCPTSPGVNCGRD